MPIFCPLFLNLNFDKYKLNLEVNLYKKIIKSFIIVIQEMNTHVETEKEMEIKEFASK